MQLGDIGEFGFIERLRSFLPPGSAIVGVGDDAAVVDLGGNHLVATADALVEGVHFRFDWSSHEDVGFKAVSVNVSDIAAMGARPRFLLVTVAAPASTPVEVLEGLYAGIAEANARYGTELIGGDTVRGSELVISVTALGEIGGRALLRSGAKVGDVLAVTGPLGRAAAGVNLLLSGDVPRDSGDAPVEDALICLDAHRRPIARVDEGRRLRNAGAHAAIDVTDGLASDAIRMAEASGIGVELDHLPIASEAASVAKARGWSAEQMVLAGGEDLELLVAVPDTFDLGAHGLIACGRVVEEGLSVVIDGTRQELEASGYDHFRGTTGS
jgi:thiamine-monophosphate kinase